jgi:hypothetical protein
MTRTLIHLQNFSKILLPVEFGIRVRDWHIKYGRTSAFPKFVGTCNAPFLSGRGLMLFFAVVGGDEGGGMVLPAATPARQLTYV